MVDPEFLEVLLLVDPEYLEVRLVVDLGCLEDLEGQLFQVDLVYPEEFPLVDLVCLEFLEEGEEHHLLVSVQGVLRAGVEYHLILVSRQEEGVELRLNLVLVNLGEVEFRLRLTQEVEVFRLQSNLVVEVFRPQLNLAEVEGCLLRVLVSPVVEEYQLLPDQVSHLVEVGYPLLNLAIHQGAEEFLLLALGEILEAVVYQSCSILATHPRFREEMVVVGFLRVVVECRVPQSAQVMKVEAEECQAHHSVLAMKVVVEYLMSLAVQVVLRVALEELRCLPLILETSLMLRIMPFRQVSFSYWLESLVIACLFHLSLGRHLSGHLCTFYKRLVSYLQVVLDFQKDFSS